MTTLSDILQKQNHEFKELHDDYCRLLRDITAMKKLSYDIMNQQNEMIAKYVKDCMIGKCYKFQKDGYIKYLHLLEFKTDENTHKDILISERKCIGNVNKKDIICTDAMLLNLLFINYEEITEEEYNSILIEKNK